MTTHTSVTKFSVLLLGVVAVSLAGILPAFAVTAPSAPTGLTATAASTSKIILNWNAPVNSISSGLIGYQIQRNGTVLVNNTSSLSTIYPDSKLTAGHSEQYQVAAWNSTGLGLLSNIASAITLSATQPNPNPHPGNSTHDDSPGHGKRGHFGNYNGTFNGPNFGHMRHHNMQNSTNPFSRNQTGFGHENGHDKRHGHDMRDNFMDHKRDKHHEFDDMKGGFFGKQSKGDHRFAPQGNSTSYYQDQGNYRESGTKDNQSGGGEYGHAMSRHHRQHDN